MVSCRGSGFVIVWIRYRISFDLLIKSSVIKIANAIQPTWLNILKSRTSHKTLICVITTFLPPPLISDGPGSQRGVLFLFRRLCRVGEEGRRQEGGREEAVIAQPQSLLIHTCSGETKTLGMWDCPPSPSSSSLKMAHVAPSQGYYYTLHPRDHGISARAILDCIRT